MSMRPTGLVALATALAIVGATASLGVSPASAADRAGGIDLTAADIVRTENGLVRGTTVTGAHTFRGIPYAAPPVGPLRWQAPQPARPWQGIKDATHARDRCAQAADPVAGTAASTSEDCLYLNVTAPATPPRRHLPVVVWLHGGGLKTGAGSDMEPRRLAVDGNAVVVTINYRLGVFGFFGYPGLPGSGTFALRDQQAALAWVRRNADRFGGDGHNMTVMGESGGGDSVCAQLTSPTARGLFDKAIIQSGTCNDPHIIDVLYPGAGDVADTWRPVGTVQTAGAQVAGELGCPTGTLDCLRAIPASKLLTDPSVAAVYWSPAYGTPLLPEHPAAAIAAGHQAHVPVLMGTTRDEATFLVALTYKTIGTDQYDQLLARAFPEHTDDVNAAYPVSRYGSPARAWSAIVTDRAYVCPNQETETTLAGLAPTYAYEFADESAPPIFDIDASFPLDAYHGSDVPYIWDIPGKQPAFTSQQRRLGQQMIGYFSRFAATGNPNRTDLPHWPAVTAGTAPTLQQLAPGTHGVRSTTTAGVHHCDLWSEIG
jgi:para-nitrobenzyl esterase